MNDYKEIDGALALVEKMCTAEQIHSLLTTRKGEEGVRLTAETKKLLIDRNLREALELKAITSSLGLLSGYKKGQTRQIWSF